MIALLPTSVDRVLAALYALPQAFCHWPADDQAGWFMHLHAQQREQRSPGVYSTSFAVRLLALSGHPDDPQIRKMIIGGMRYLLAQFRDAAAVTDGTKRSGKEWQKIQEVGHTDFSLTLKCVALLEASNAIGAIRDMHGDFAKLLNSCEADLDRLAATVKQHAAKDLRAGVSLCGWPWHFIDPSEPDVLPTVDVALTLSAPQLRGSPRYLDHAHDVSHYLIAAGRTTPTVVHKAIAVRALWTLFNALNLTADFENKCADLIADLVSAGHEINAYPWQEVLHYQVPSKRQPISHYKPWLWICPRIEIAHALLFCGAGMPVAHRVAADIIANTNRHNGVVRFLQAQPPTLLANLRAALFLRDMKAYGLNTTGRRVSFAVVGIRQAAGKLLERRPELFFSLLFALSWALFFPSSLSRAQIGLSWTLLSETLSRVVATWPLWALLIVAALAFSRGALKTRLRTTILLFITTVVLGVLVNILAAETTR